MNERLTFGIVGGYGATGRAAAAELWKSGAGDIVIGGRDLAKGKALAAQFDHRVSAVQVDVFDACSLDSFCNACSIIVNSGGPVMALQDRVAQSAFRTHCNLRADAWYFRHDGSGFSCLCTVAQELGRSPPSPHISAKFPAGRGICRGSGAWAISRPTANLER